MGAITHNGEVLQRLPANASQINFDNTGTDLNSTQAENAIKEVNSKVNNLGYCNVLNAEPITLAGDAELNNITNVGVYGNILYPSNLGHSPEPNNTDASRVKLLVSQTGSSLMNSIEQQITIINGVSGVNNTYKRQFLNNAWSDWTSYDKDIASLRSGLTNLQTVTITASEGVTISDASIKRVGKVIIGYATIELASDVATYGVVATLSVNVASKVMYPTDSGKLFYTAENDNKVRVWRQTSAAAYIVQFVAFAND